MKDQKQVQLPKYKGTFFCEILLAVNGGKNVNGVVLLLEKVVRELANIFLATVERD